MRVDDRYDSANLRNAYFVFHLASDPADAGSSSVHSTVRWRSIRRSTLGTISRAMALEFLGLQPALASDRDQDSPSGRAPSGPKRD